MRKRSIDIKSFILLASQTGGLQNYQKKTSDSDRDTSRRELQCNENLHY